MVDRPLVSGVELELVESDDALAAFYRCTWRTFGVVGREFDNALAIGRASMPFVRRYSARLRSSGDQPLDREPDATFAEWPMAQCLPGGADLAAWAVSAVTTSLSARRRGLLSVQMSAHRERVLAAEVSGSVLVAAEWPIYGRFGFGPTTDSVDMSVNSGLARMRPEVLRRVADAGVTVDHEDPGQVWPAAEALFKARRAEVVGDVERSFPGVFATDFGLGLAPSLGSRWGGWVLAARSAAGELLGWARYSSEAPYPESDGAVITIDDMWTPDPIAYAALWSALFDIDLVATIRATERPPDELLRRLVVDPRHVRVGGLADGCWTRLWRTQSVLASVVPASAGSLVLGVRDLWLDGSVGTAAGTFRWSGDPEVGECESVLASGAEPDLVLDVGTLASILFSNATLRELAAAGEVEERRPGGIARAHRMFARDARPWISSHF